MVGKKEDLAINGVVINNINMFINDKKFICDVKLRFRSTIVKCEVEIKDEKATIKLKEPIYGVAVGQIAVFYDDDKLIGSGIIIETI